MTLWSIRLMGTACLRIGPKLARNEGGIVVFPHGDFHGGVWFTAPFVEVIIDMNKTKKDKIARKSREKKRNKLNCLYIKKKFNCLQETCANKYKK